MDTERSIADADGPVPAEPQPTSAFKSRSGLGRLGSAMGYTIAGLQAAWRNEHAFRQELMLFVPAAIAIPFIPVPLLHQVLLAAALLVVLVVELLNSAIEAVVDRVSLDRHPLSKRAKDLGSAAVFLALVAAGMVWAAILVPLALR